MITCYRCVGRRVAEIQGHLLSVCGWAVWIGDEELMKSIQKKYPFGSAICPACFQSASLEGRTGSDRWQIVVRTLKDAELHRVAFG